MGAVVFDAAGKPVAMFDSLVLPMAEASSVHTLAVLSHHIAIIMLAQLSDRGIGA